MATLTHPPRAFQAQTTTPTHDVPSYDPHRTVRRRLSSTPVAMDQPTVNNNDLVMEGAEYTHTVDERVSLLPPGHHADHTPVAMHSIVRITAASTESMTLS